jgi:hypothetical protein
MAGVAAFLIAVIAYPILHPPKPVAPPRDDEGPEAPLAFAPPRADAQAATPPRCTVVGAPVPFVAKGEAIDLGESIAMPNGAAAVGFRHGLRADASIAIAKTTPALTLKRVDLGSAYPDAPPPKLAFIDGNLATATFVKITPTKLFAVPGAPVADSAIRIQQIDEDGNNVTAIGDVVHVADDSLDFDFSIADKGGFVAFEEDEALKRWGVVTVATIDVNNGMLHVDPKSIAVSPDGTDADSPRVLAHAGGGATIAWIATKNEPTDAGPAERPVEITQTEGPAERRAYRWIEVAEIDPKGALKGSVRRVTSLTGHVGAFVLARRNVEGRDESAFDVIARDDDQIREGAGSRILRITVTVNKIDPPIVLANDVGLGVPALLASSASPESWIAYVDGDDHACIVPLMVGALGANAAASVEPALDHAIPFAALGAHSIAAFFVEPAVARVLSCGPPP